MIESLKKMKGIALPFILICFFVLGAVFAAGQDNSKYSFVFNPTPTPTPPVKKPLPKPVIVNVPNSTNNPRIKEKVKEDRRKRQIYNESPTAAEKSIAVEAKVNLQFCVSEGKVRINGWDRNEIRAYVNGGSQIGFKILQKSRQNQNPVWVQALGFDPSKNRIPNADECLSGDEIELDVPRGASIRLNSYDSEITIESVEKVWVDNGGGNIFLNEINGGIEAVTKQGGITVGKSGGTMNLGTNEGNIVAYEVSPSEIGDVFKAKTLNGMINLDRIEHRQIEINSFSGSISFAGEFLSGGRYLFGTHSGSVLLSIPETSSCQVNAFYGTGQFVSDIRLQNERRTGGMGAQNVTGRIGNGEATLILKTYSGRLNIKKQ